MSEGRQTAPLESLLFTAEEVASLLGIGRTKVFEMLASGELSAIRIGRCVRISKAQLETWVDEKLEVAGLSRRLPSDEPPRCVSRRS